jgi:hypothetical protein
MLKYLQTKSTATTYGISSSSTTIQLKNLLKLDGSSVSVSDIGDLLYGTFAPGTSREEIFSIVGSNVTVESDGKITITSVTRGLKEVEPYNAGGYSCDHPAGEVVVFGNNPQVYASLKNYIDNAILTGSIPATDVIPGISIEATVSDIDADTEERTYNSIAYKLFINPAKLILSKFGLRLPTSDQKSALNGTQGVPNATNKYVTFDNVYDSDTDQTQTTQNGTIEFGVANTTGNKNIICQSFIPSKTKIRGVKLYKIANTGTFTGDVEIEILNNDAGSPGEDSLGFGSITNATYNALSVGEFEILLSSELSLVAGTTYWIKVSSTTSDSSNHPNLGTNTAGGYTSGSVKYYNVTDGYVAIANIDLYFKTLQGKGSQIPQNNQDGTSKDMIICKIGNFSKNLADATGSVTTIPHGLGKIPKRIQFKGTYLMTTSTATQIVDSVWVSDGVQCMNLYSKEGGSTAVADAIYISSTYILGFGGEISDDPFGTGRLQKATITVDDTNFYLTWTKPDTITGTAYIIWTAETN